MNMSLDVSLNAVRTIEVFTSNITHNLNDMADEAGIYMELWRPDEIGITRAKELIEPLTKALELLKSNPSRFEKFNAPNGFGMYEHFVPFVEKYLNACIENPNAIISTCK